VSAPNFRLDGKIALVTGTGSGLGQAIAIALAHHGADLAITELPSRLDAARATARSIEQLGRRVDVVALDVLQLTAIEAAVDEALRAFGRIDILVNNAGVNVPRLALEVTEADWDRVVDIDLKGLFFTTQAVASKAMIPGGGGKIVNIASIMGAVGYTHRAAYCSAKAGVVALTRVLAFEWAKHRINVNAVGPTFVETPLTRSLFEDPAFREDVLRRIPLGRLGTPDDVAGAVVYLASSAADLVTGHHLLVDGGWTAV